MANVGNLFINVTGNTKGLTKALSSAKTKLATFDKQVGRPRGDFMRRARGRFQGAMAERQRFEAISAFVNRMSMRHGLDVPGMDKEAALRRARLGKNEKVARQAYRSQQREMTISGMKKTMGVAFGAIGLSIAMVSMIVNKAINQAKAASEGAKRFEAIGPEGGKIVQERVAMLIDQIKYAQSAKGSAEMLRQAQAQRAAQARAYETGSAGAYMRFETLLEETGTNFMTGLASPGQRLTEVLPVYQMSNANSVLDKLERINNAQGGY
jgi:hypothetical protein